MKKLACTSVLWLAAGCFNPPAANDPTGSMTTSDTDPMGNTTLTDGSVDGVSSSDEGPPPVTCTDGVQGGDESDVDCGGSCGPCDDGQGCAVPEDCSSGVCEAEVCQAPACGDGVVQPGEACDDAGKSVTCNADCTLASCGDGVVTGEEECDDDGESATCNDNCTLSSCGDTVPNATAGEDCDDGEESATCNEDCTTAACGNQIVNATAGEDCDEAGNTEACDADCTFVSCGDGFSNPVIGEDCDDGAESASCDVDCTAVSCGDGTINAAAGEACEGGPADVCTASCQVTGCGPDPVALAMASCLAQFASCDPVNGGVVGYDPVASCTGCNCGTPAEPWRFFCTATSDDMNFNCSACSVGQILAPHDPCECGGSTSPVQGTFCIP